MPLHYDHFGTYWIIKPYVYASPYLVIAIIAAIAGMLMAYFEMKRRKIGSEKKHIILSSILVYILLVSFARLFFFLGPWSWKQYPAWTSRISGIFSFDAGMVFYGGLIGSIIGLFVYAKIKKLDPWQFADIWAPSIGIVLFFARIGCYTSGCCAGLHSGLALPWLIEREGSIIHPTQLYSSLLGLVIFVAMTELKYRQAEKKLFSGYVALWGLALYSIGRFFIEFLRYYDSRFFGLTSSQLISMAIFGICSVLLIFGYRNQGRKGAKHQNIYK